MKIQQTTKSWYRAYNFKVIITGIDSKVFKTWIQTTGWDVKIVVSLPWFARGGRDNVEQINVFLSDCLNVSELSKIYSKNIVEIWKPLNDQISCALLSDRNLIIRPSLFLKKYRIRIDFQYDWHFQGNPFLEEFVEDHLVSNLNYSRNDWKLVSNGYQPHLYLAHQTDLMLLKLLDTDNNIRKVSFVKLSSEV